MAVTVAAMIVAAGLQVPPAPVEAAAQSVALTPAADTYVKSSASTSNYGAASPLAATSSDTRTLLRFGSSGQVPAGSSLTAVKLRLYVTMNLVTTGGAEVHPSSGSWDESTVTWATQPAWNSAVHATSSTPKAGQWIEISLPLSAVNLSGDTNLGLRYTVSGSAFQFESRESNNDPELVLSYDATTPAGTQSFAPLADSYVQASNSAANFGAASELSATSSDTRAYLKLATGGTVPDGSLVRTAKLRLYTTNNAVTTGGFEVHVSRDGWTESGINWSNQPSWSSQVLATSMTPTAGQWAEINLPPHVVNTGGNTNLAVRYTTSGSNAKFASREAVNKPELVITYAPMPVASTAMTPTADTFVRGSASTINYGSEAYLTGTSSDAWALMRFDTTSRQLPTGTSLSGAKLRLYVINNLVTTGGAEVHAINGAWSESTVTWQTKPAVNSVVLATSTTPTSGQWVEVTLPASAISLTGGTELAVRYTTSGSTFQFGSREAANKPQLILQYDPVLMAAGDIACPASSIPGTNTCYQGWTSDLLLSGNPDAVAALGDTQYSNGELSDYLAVYDKSWGRFKDRTRPASGNHEYADPAGGAKGFYDYFNGVGVQDGPAGDRSKGYFSYNVGRWHMVVLNSECSQVPGGCGPGSPQATWLQADLAANTSACTLAYWHKPRFTSGGEYAGYTSFGDLWNIMVGDVDVALSGHSHMVEVYGKVGATPPGSTTPVIDANGIKQFVVGSGGKDHYAFTGGPQLDSNGNSAVYARDDDTHGVLRLVLKPTGYDWELVPVPGMTYHNADSQTTGAFSGSDSCSS